MQQLTEPREFGQHLALLRQNLKWRHPDVSPEEIEQRLEEWLLRRPGAEFGDGVGKPVE